MGSIQKQAIQNTVISYLGVAIGFVNTLILQPKMLLPEELGLTRILYSVSILIASLFPLGLNAFSIKYFPKFRNPENGHNGYFGILLRVALFGYALVGALVYLFKGNILEQYQNSPLFIEYFAYIFPMSLFLGFISILNIYASCLFKTSVPSFLNEVFIRLMTMLIVSLYFLKAISFPVFVFLFVASLCVQVFFLLVYIIKTDKISLRINREFLKTLEIRKTLNYVLILSIATLASMAMRNNIDNIFIGSYLDLEQVAVYSVAFLVASMIEVPASALGKIADPKISDALTRNDFRLIKEVYYKSTRLLMIIGGLLFTGLYINTHELLSLLPDKYLMGSNVVLIISISAFSNMATGINSSIIFFSDKYKLGSAIFVALTVLSVILNMLLIPLWGIEGAAVATAGTLLLSNIFKTLIIFRAYGLQPFGVYIFVVLGLIGACVGIDQLLPQVANPILDIAYRSSIITAVYSAGIYFSGIAGEAVAFAKNLLNR